MAIDPSTRVLTDVDDGCERPATFLEAAVPTCFESPRQMACTKPLGALAAIGFVLGALACGGGPAPQGTPIPTLVEDTPMWVDAAGTPFLDVELTTLEPRSSGTAAAYVQGRGWVLVDLDAVPVELVDAPCNPSLDTADACGMPTPEQEAPTCRIEVRDTGAVETVPGPRRADGSYIMVEEPVREVWHVTPSGQEHLLSTDLIRRKCIGEAVVGTSEDPSRYGLFRGEQALTPSYASDYRIIGIDRVLLQDAQTELWDLYNAQGEKLRSEIREVTAAPKVLVPWQGRNGGFPQAERSIAVTIGDGCGWMSLDGETLAGFEPGWTGCSAPADGHGFAVTPEGSAWVPLVPQ